ncbi:MAG: hypothetical protein WD875_11630 [Pirellulales bacterium]
MKEEARRELSKTPATAASAKRGEKVLDKKQDDKSRDVANGDDKPQGKVAAAPAGSAKKVDAKKPDVKAMIRSAYLRTLSRPPTAEEEQRIRAHLAATGQVAGLRDVVWALLNSKEFIINH